MGISGLLPLLKSIQRPTELRKFNGETLGVDGYGWLHRGTIACAVELAQDKPTRKYVDFAMHRVKMLQHFGVTPYMVFDGDFLPSKAHTEETRAKRREESKKAGLGLLKAGKPSQAHLELQKAIDVTPEMARMLIEELKKAGVPYVVAPYEADAQLVYLERCGLITGILSEDSDLLVFGAKRLLTKLDKYGQCIEINRRDFCAVREISLTGWTDAEFRHMAILSGCDYLQGLDKIGLKTAYRLIRKHKTPEQVVKMLQFGGKHRVAANYLEAFRQAELTFLHQRVFDPVKQELVCMTEPDSTVDVDSMPFIGRPVDARTARAIAAGDVNPITKERIVVPGNRSSSPSKRRISQIMAAPAPHRPPSGKPIDQYFKGHRRIPLGEMDPNCFKVEPRRTSDIGTVAIQPRVFPLPRPYLDEAAAPPEGPARPYMNRRALRRSEPIMRLIGMESSVDSDSSSRPTEPTFQVHQDGASSSSMRPPKKARLCEDLQGDDSTDLLPALASSKFFPSKAAKTPKVETFLMSDDSIEEALRDMPDFDSWHAVGTTKSGKQVAVFEDTPAQGEKQSETAEAIPASSKDDDNLLAEDAIEVPASSPGRSEKEVDMPLPPPPKSTPLEERMKEFCYKPVHTKPVSAARGTRMAYGLPTPSSSTERPDAVMAPPVNAAIYASTPMSTPLQRMGARVLQQSQKQSPMRAWASPSTSATKAQGPRLTGKAKQHEHERENGPVPSLHPVDPALVPLPKVDIAEVEALNAAMMGSEDQIIPDSDDENDPLSTGRGRLDLSRFVYA